VKALLLVRNNHASDLLLPSGELVACDPFYPEHTQPFTLQLPRGAFSVVLSVAHKSTDQRIAYATVRFRQSVPITWGPLTVRRPNVFCKLKAGTIFGYGVDSDSGCFIDGAAAPIFDEASRQRPDFFDTMEAEMQKSHRHTCSWLDMKFGQGNLIAFSSGYGDGVYATFAGRDSDGEVSVVVTDFAVVPEGEFPA
jgi:hypothetical protein